VGTGQQRASRPNRQTRPYRSSRREAQARRTRRRVLAAATALFLDRGYAGTTMRGVAAGSHVSVPTVEALFGTKARLLAAAIDVAIAGDDEPVPVLDRAWADDARRAQAVEDFCSIVAGVLASTQARAAGLVLAVFEGASTDPELGEVAARLVDRRAETAAWLVDGVSRTAGLRAGCSREEAVDTVWVLMDPAVFDRLTRQRDWTVERYEAWFALSLRRLLTAITDTDNDTDTDTDVNTDVNTDVDTYSETRAEADPVARPAPPSSARPGRTAT
jgi:AcrR family transcriptional regulator